MRSLRTTTSHRILPALLLSTVAVGSLIAGGCSSDSGMSSTADAQATTTLAAPTQTVSASGEHVYGSNHLVGDGTDGTEAVNVEMLATVNYTNGSGDFDGVITFTYADGSTLGFDMVDGSTVAATDTTDATFHSELEVIGGTGRYVNTTGTGTFDGSRKDALGGAVEMTFALRLA